LGLPPIARRPLMLLMAAPVRFPNRRRWLARPFRPGRAPVTDIKRALIIYLLSDFVALNL
jgi:hypothetical protein